MALTPSLDSVESLFRKAEREQYRAHHQRGAIHKADHFYNFCITVDSLRDYLLERLGKVTSKERRLVESELLENSLIVTVADVANTAKHFQLRARSGVTRNAKAKSVKHARTTMYDIFLDEHQDIVVKKRPSQATLHITNEDNSRYDLYVFMHDVLEFWTGELTRHGVTLRKQTVRQLRGPAI